MSGHQTTSRNAGADPRIAVLPLFYGRTSIVTACLDSLIAARRTRRFSLFAIENPSEYSADTRPVLIARQRQGEIEGLYLARTNAVFNSLLYALSADIFDLERRFDYVVLSDGDIGVKGDFLAEQAALLKAYPRISTASLRIDISKWDQASRTFDKAVIYAAAPTAAEKAGRDHAESGGGFWMRMFRTADLFRMVRDFDANGFRLRDGQIDAYFRTRGMYPACTIKSKGVELARGPFYEKADRTQPKAAAERPKNVAFFSLWNHDIEPDGRVIAADGSRRIDRDAPRLAAPASPEVHAELAASPVFAGLDLQLFRQARVAQTLAEADGAPSVVLMPDPPLRRVMLANEGRQLMLPFDTVLGGPAPRFLHRIGYDAREEEARSPTLLRLFQLASRLLTLEGELVVEAVDWRELARTWAAALDRAERRAGQLGGAEAAREAADLGKAFLGRGELCSAGDLALAARKCGLKLRDVRRGGEPGDRTPWARFTYTPG